MLENNRKLFSRQSSPATRPNSAITENIGDSNIDTLNTKCESEIREQQDTFDISHDKSTEKNESTRALSSMRRNLKSPCAMHESFRIVPRLLRSAVPVMWCIPYTSSKRMETALSDLPPNNNDNFNLVISQPSFNKNDHYPNKNQLATFHYGFKTI